MTKSKIIYSLNIKKYFFLLLVSNFFSILFLSDTTSLNLGFISLQSLFYCLNSYLFIIFIFYETISSYLDLYGLTLNFLLLVFTNPRGLNFDFNFYIFFTNFKYFLFFVFNLFFLIYYLNIIYVIKTLFKKKYILILLLGFFIFLFFSFKKYYFNQFNLISNRVIEKLSLIINRNILRDDNWYIVLRNTINYSQNTNVLLNFSFEEKYRNFETSKNIYIIINESYPNFKDPELKGELYSVLTSNLDQTNIFRFKKDWNKNYSTQGSEMELFCDNKGNWKDFQKDLDFFLKKNKCWINKFYDGHNIFVHSYTKISFDRYRYFNNEDSFFKESFFKQDLLNLGYSSCKKNINFIGICENEIIDKLLFKIKNEIDKPKVIVYLTVENHIPINFKYNKSLKCKNYTLNLHPEFCALFNNQIIFNQSLNKFIKQLHKDDLLIFFSDTPPLFAKKNRIHFEDHIDVIFFKGTKFK